MKINSDKLNKIHYNIRYVYNALNDLDGALLCLRTGEATHESIIALTEKELDWLIKQEKLNGK